MLYLAICRLPEYYLTRTEASIFAQNREAIAEVVGVGKQLVDLCTGNCRKAAEWFHFLKPSRYFAVDIAEAHLERCLGRLAEEFPDTGIVGIVIDIADGLRPVAGASRGRTRHARELP